MNNLIKSIILTLVMILAIDAFGEEKKFQFPVNIKESNIQVKQIPLERNKKVVTLFSAKKEESLSDISLNQFKKFIKNFDHKTEDEISLLWLQMPFLILNILLGSITFFIAILTFVKNNKEKARENYFHEKEKFRNSWKKIRMYDEKILSKDINELKDNEKYKRKAVKAEIDALLDHLDDIFLHYKSFTNPHWKEWERDFRKVFSKKLIYTSFQKSMAYSFSDKFKNYVTKLIEEYTDTDHTLDKEFTETVAGENHEDEG